jgi:peptidyl-prolyl cis-trans isomerase C
MIRCSPVVISLLSLIAGATPARPADAPDPAPSAPGESPAGIVATVNGEPIYFEDVERRLADMHSGQPAASRAAFDVDQLMFRLVNDALLAQEARALDMQLDAPIPAQIEKLRESLAVKRLEREEIWGGAETSEDEARAAYARDYRTVTLRIITVDDAETATGIRAALEAGADFETLARERSIDSYSARGGLIHALSYVDLPPELAEAAFDSNPGTIVGPLQTGLGWALIRPESVSEAAPEDFAEREKSVRQVVRLRKAEALRSEFGRRLFDQHAASIDSARVAAIGARRLPDGRLVPTVEDPDAVVAQIADRAITVAELGRALQLRWRGVRNEEAALAAKPIVLDRLLLDELMTAEALDRGYGDTPAVARALRAYETQLLVPRFLKEVVSAGLEATDEEMRAFYDENLESFRRPPRIYLGQITVATREEGEQIAELLRQGADLAWLARQHSIDGLKDSGGDKGWVVPVAGSNPLDDRLLEAQPGDVLGPAGFPGSFEILRVNAREEQGYFTFEESATRVRSAVLTRKFEEALDETIRTLRSRSTIEVDRAALATMSITATPVEESEDAHGHGG